MKNGKNEDPGRRQDGTTKDTGQLICRFLPWAGSGCKSTSAPQPTSCLLVQATRLARFHGSTGLDPVLLPSLSQLRFPDRQSADDAHIHFPECSRLPSHSRPSLELSGTDFQLQKSCRVRLPWPGSLGGTKCADLLAGNMTKLRGHVMGFCY